MEKWSGRFCRARSCPSSSPTSRCVRHVAVASCKLQSAECGTAGDCSIRCARAQLLLSINTELADKLDKNLLDATTDKFERSLVDTFSAFVRLESAGWRCSRAASDGDGDVSVRPCDAGRQSENLLGVLRQPQRRRGDGEGAARPVPALCQVSGEGDPAHPVRSAARGLFDQSASSHCVFGSIFGR
jgi:hypothetical protein